VDQGEGFDPAGIEVFVGIDMAKGDHYAQARDSAGSGNAPEAATCAGC
jgi:hypothetical protein